VSENQAAETPEVQTGPLAALIQDNYNLAEWVIGILEGCEGCIEQAKTWAAGQEALRTGHAQAATAAEDGDDSEG